MIILMLVYLPRINMCIVLNLGYICIYLAKTARIGLSSCLRHNVSQSTALVDLLRWYVKWSSFFKKLQIMYFFQGFFVWQ